MSHDLEYSVYNKERFAVRGNRDQYQDIMKQLGGRWNSRMRGGEGWLVPLDREQELIRLVNEMQVDKKKRYHREQSENENDHDSEESSESADEDYQPSEEEDDLELIDPIVAEMLEANREAATEQQIDNHQGEGSYYKQINSVKYDRALLEYAESMTEGQGDGRISRQDAVDLIEQAKDGKGVTECELRTLEHILKNYTCTESATLLLSEALSYYGASQEKLKKEDITGAREAERAREIETERVAAASREEERVREMEEERVREMEEERVREMEEERVREMEEERVREMEEERVREMEEERVREMEEESQMKRVR